ncbi:hypothetical protein BCR36DRAFT_461282 [Piromyces finnis]|uniref:KN homeodomain domain-containing protein n=1 Tax=Piromyces finnis TaxID=1754191 RepID=A0A1Y1V004_9FUNG|nr:hypothetical protein BCR36DRAFT_461282 [Piromyces finnis]|eukprot:ORX43066.1 hypothetical protein BCR36DRAFT_461282 [Piromyces finnis]
MNSKKSLFNPSNNFLESPNGTTIFKRNSTLSNELLNDIITNNYTGVSSSPLMHLITRKRKNESIQNINQKSKQSNNSVFSILSSQNSFTIENKSPILNNTSSSPVPIIDPSFISSSCLSFELFSFNDIFTSFYYSNSIITESCSNLLTNQNKNKKQILNQNINPNPNPNINKNLCNYKKSIKNAYSNTILKENKQKKKYMNSKGHKQHIFFHRMNNILKEWLSNHSFYYPTINEKCRLCEATGLTMLDIWFINARRRYA